MVFEHDYKKFPELTNEQLADYGFSTPHVQYTDDFEAKVVKVKDGDTYELETKDRDFTFPLRLAAVDTKELSAGGEESKLYVQTLLEGRNVTIQIDRENRVGRYGRLIGRVLVHGLDVSEDLERQGLAVPFGMKGQELIKNIEKELDVNKWLT